VSLAVLYELEDRLFLSYTDAESGAKLTYRSSLSVLNHFVATFPTANNETMLQPTYIIQPETNYDLRDPQRHGFACEVILPENFPVTSMVGEIQGKKAIAKCSAAFNMCMELRRKDLIDSNLLPTMQKHLPLMRNALLAVSEKKKGVYPMLIKPEFWKHGRDNTLECLYLTKVDVDAGLDRPHQPLGFLSRQSLPQLPDFPIYLTDGRASNIVSQPVTTPIRLTSELLEMVTKFTLRIFEDIFQQGVRV
jgi:endoribonuclease Dicer